MSGNLNPSNRRGIPREVPLGQALDAPHESQEAHQLFSPVPSSHARPSRGQRSVVAAAPDPLAAKQLIREMRTRAGLTDAELGRRMGISRQAVTESCNAFTTCDHTRRPSFVWVVRLAILCGARVLIEMPDDSSEMPRRGPKRHEVVRSDEEPDAHD